MKIRKFVPQDLKRVYEIENMSFDRSYEINVFQQLYNMGVGFLVAEKNSYVVGYVIFWRKYENQGHIISIAVDKNYRMLGVGKKLLARAISVLSLLDIQSIFLEVSDKNKGAFEFYKKCDFQVDRIVPNYYNNGEGAILMYLPLKHSEISR